MSRPLASNYSTWRKSLLKDYVERYYVSLPDLAKYKRRDNIDAIKKDQRQFRNLPVKIITHFWKPLKIITWTLWVPVKKVKY